MNYFNLDLSAGILRELKVALNTLRETKHTNADMSVELYVMEFRNIGVTLPRQCGKSRWIAHNSRAGDLIICPNMHMAEHMKRTYHVNAYGYNQVPPATIYGTPIEQRHIPQVIFLDESNPEMNRVAISRIVSPHQIIVSLGT